MVNRCCILQFLVHCQNIHKVGVFLARRWSLQWIVTGLRLLPFLPGFVKSFQLETVATFPDCNTILKSRLVYLIANHPRAQRSQPAGEFFTDNGDHVFSLQTLSLVFERHSILYFVPYIYGRWLWKLNEGN